MCEGRGRLTWLKLESASPSAPAPRQWHGRESKSLHRGLAELRPAQKRREVSGPQPMASSILQLTGVAGPMPREETEAASPSSLGSSETGAEKCERDSLNEEEQLCQDLILPFATNVTKHRVQLSGAASSRAGPRGRTARSLAQDGHCPQPQEGRGQKAPVLGSPGPQARRQLCWDHEALFQLPLLPELSWSSELIKKRQGIL